jgi:hypothetical protein
MPGNHLRRFAVVGEHSHAKQSSSLLRGCRRAFSCQAIVFGASRLGKMALGPHNFEKVYSDIPAVPPDGLILPGRGEPLEFLEPVLDEDQFGHGLGLLFLQLYH